jgi:UDP-glucose 4-epimerase
VVDGLLRLVDNEAALGEVFNIGSSEEITIAALAERVRSITGSESPIEFVPYEQAYASGFEDMRRRVPDTAKVRALTGWKPTRSLEDVLRETMDEAAAELQLKG